MNDIEHNFFDSISAEKILQWKATIQQLIHVDFSMGFPLDHLCEIAQVFFVRRIQPTIDAIDTHIKNLEKEVTDLKAHHECLLFGVVAPNHFEDQTLISVLWLFSTYSVICYYDVALLFLCLSLSLHDTLYFFSTYDLFDKSNMT